MGTARPEGQRDAAPMTAVLEIKDLRFRWPGENRPLLAIGHARLEAGASLFLSGPSGSGKSTLLSLLGGVLRADSGQILVLGEDLGALSGRGRDAFRAEHVGFIFQMFNLLPYLGIVENVLLPARFSAARHERAVARSGTLEAEAARLLHALGLDPITCRRNTAGTLSLGQQQRVAAARALLGAPPLVIADEPTSALDEDNRERFLELVFAECRSAGSALILVSHDRRLGSLFDHQVGLDELNDAHRDDAVRSASP